LGSSAWEDDLGLYSLRPGMLASLKAMESLLSASVFIQRKDREEFDDIDHLHPCSASWNPNKQVQSPAKGAGTCELPVCLGWRGGVRSGW
jgi:hypothetical protein